MSDLGFDPEELASATVEDLGSVVVVRLTGEIDVATRTVVGEPLFACLAARPPAVVIDLTRIEFIGSTGVNILLHAHLKARRDSIDLRVVACTHAVLRPLEVSGLTCHLPISRSLPDALAHLATGLNTGPNAGLNVDAGP